MFLATDCGCCVFLVLLGLTGVLRLPHDSEVNDLERPQDSFVHTSDDDADLSDSAQMIFMINSLTDKV